MGRHTRFPASDYELWLWVCVYVGIRVGVRSGDEPKDIWAT